VGKGRSPGEAFEFCPDLGL